MTGAFSTLMEPTLFAYSALPPIPDRNNPSMRENSSVDLLEYVAKLLLYDDIIRHITTVSFGAVIHESEKFVQVLKDVLPDFEVCINSPGKDIVGNSNLKMVHKIVNQHLSSDTSISKLHRSDEKRLCFEAAFLLLFSNREEADDSKIRTIYAFLQKYPEFKDEAMIEPAEQEKLLKFRNMMKLAQLFIPAKNHKEHLMDLVTRLVEGRDQKYVTGSGEKPATRRRVLIYEREGEIRPVPRPPRMHAISMPLIAAVTPLINANETATETRNDHENDNRKRKEMDHSDFEDGETTALANTVTVTDLLAAAAMTVRAIPLAPKLHHIHGRIKMKIVPQILAHTSSAIFFQESVPLKHVHDRYHSHTPQTQTLSSLLDQHNDQNFIEENLTAVKR